jgi:hypothetical protein
VEEKKTFVFTDRVMRKRRHHRRDQKWSKFCPSPSFKPKKKKTEEKKKRANFSSHFSAEQNTREREREREKKRMSENIIVANKDNTKRMTTRERQQIEVAKLEAELNALKVDAFAKVRLLRLFF